MTNNKKVLVTGGAGYVGSVLVHSLIENGYFVRVVDNLKWGGESLLGLINHPRFEFQKGDVRQKEDVIKAVKGIDSIIHLAAIVGDPACKLEPELAESTNYKGSVLLYNQAIENGVKRFIFGSTCSNYGKMANPNQFVTEDSPLAPVSLYAELKVKFEKFLMQSEDNMVSTALRFSTAYGLSPRMRFDLTVSEFTRDAFVKKELVIFGEQFWRPYCHTQDLANACQFIMEADSNKVNKQAFNVGHVSENFQKKMLVDEILKVIPELKVQYVKKNEDPRDYRVNFDKIESLGFKTSKTVRQGILEVIRMIDLGLIQDPYSKKYSNI